MNTSLPVTKPLWHVAALYRFVTIDDAEALRSTLFETFEALDIVGLLLIAPEGINGTLAGSESSIAQMVDVLDEACGIRQGEVKYSTAHSQPFKRLKVRLKQEIITMRSEKARPTERVGTYVEPSEWNRIINDPDVLVLDTRNDYEVSIGTFKHAVNPDIQVFTEFAPYVEAHIQPHQHKKVAMFCTGGIRCEKASSYMLNQGFETVYHLKGGILKYLEEVPEEESLWQGDCFVFDDRIGVTHGLEQSELSMCYSCGWPLTTEAKQHPKYETGVSCHRCFDTVSPERKAAFRMRQQQKYNK
jgi:UPF0176 protein